MSDTLNGQETTDETTVEAVPTSEQPAEEAQEPTLPDGVKDRTAEEFEKLKTKNHELSEELKTLKGGTLPTSVLDELRPTVGTVPSATVPTGVSYFDNEGYVDPTLLNKAIASTQQSADDAKNIALRTQQEIQKFQETQIVQKVHAEYPEIDPNSDQFDPRAYDFVKNDLIGQMMKGKEDLGVAAAKARTIFAPSTSAAKPEQITSREQASASTSTATRTPSAIDREALVQATYKGDKDAIFKRLQDAGI